MGCGPSHRSNKVEPIVEPVTKFSDSTYVSPQHITRGNHQDDRQSTLVELPPQDDPEGKLIIDLTWSAEEIIPILQAELSKLQPYGTAKNTATTESPLYEDTSKAQATLIAKLERELKQAKDEVVTVKQKCDKQIKRMRVSNAKVKAGSDIQVLNLKAELSDTAMKLENCKAEVDKLESARSKVGETESDSISRSRSRMRGNNDDDDDNDDSDDDGGAHMNLILSLSEQIASQDEELTALRKELELARKPEKMAQSPTPTQAPH
eukprot:m.119679 g.119679  ORF g.119679 m.119679 type:complete len:264 (+) comp28753_c0_seq1:285-1076(+)